MAKWKLRGIESRDYQLSLAEQIASNQLENYVLWMPPGMGKTIVAYLAMARAKEMGKIGDDEKVLVVPHSRSMEEQWYSFAQKFGVTDNANVLRNRSSGEYHGKTGSLWGKGARSKIGEWKREIFRDSDIVLSTPRLLSTDIEQRNFDRNMIDKTRLVFLDEAGKTIVPDQEDPVWNYRTNSDYAKILDTFLDKKQIVGLTATPGRDNYEARMLEEKLKARIIGPTEEDIEKYAPKVDRRKFYIVDPWVEKVDSELKSAINLNLRRIEQRTGINMNSFRNQAVFWKFLDSRARDKDPEVAYSARETRRAVYARLLLFDHSFNEFSNYVGFHNQSYARRGVEPTTSWQNISSLTEERAKTEPVSSKTRQFVKLAKLSVDKGEKVLVFDRFVGGCKELQKALEVEGIKSLVVTGKMDGPAQSSVFSDFEKGDAPVLISTTGVGGAGVDLPFVNTVIQYGTTYSPVEMQQRAGRIRGGVEKCLVYKDTTEDKKFREMQSSLSDIERIVRRVSNDPKLSAQYRSLLEDLEVS